MKKIIPLLLCFLLLPLHSFGADVGESIVFGMISSKTYLIDPFCPQERDLVSVYNVIYDSLIEIDDDGLPVGKLATEWAYTNGGKNWSFTIRDDVFFSDGTKLTAYDIAASGNYILGLYHNEEVTDKGFYQNMHYTVESFEAKSETILNVKASRPYYGLLYAMVFPIVQQDSLGSTNPIGSGPYMITGFETGNYMMLNTNPHWWQMQPQVKEITIMFYPNSKDVISAYEYGQVDAVFTRSVAAAQYKSGSNAISIQYSTRQLEVLMLNHRKRSYPLDSLNVRKAIRYAINENMLINNVYMGLTAKANTPVPADSWLYLDQETTFVYNPDKARELLAQDGWSDLDGNGVLDKINEGENEPKHLVLSLYVYEDPENDVRYESANLIADMLLEIGISAHVETVSFADAKTVLENGNFDMFLCAFQMDVIPDYGFFLRKGNKQNYGAYTSSEMTSLIDTLRTQTSQGDFYYTTSAIQQLFAQDVPFLSLFYRTGAILTRKVYSTVRTYREFELLRGIESFGR